MTSSPSRWAPRPHDTHFTRLMLLIAFALAPSLGGCCRTYPSPATPTVLVRTPSRAASESLTPVQQLAVDWVRRARAAEPGVTLHLQQVAERESVTLVGLEHKIKTLASTISKLERLQAKNPEQALEDIDVYDALRYTLLVPDEPSGHHDAVIRGALVTFEQAGFGIRKVKNYWPRGDSYSGTNCILETPAGLAWELQFHTPDSYAIKSRVHDDYDRMRSADTPIEERRRLFEQMKAVWESIPIPAGILVPGSLHANEEIRLLPAP